MKIDFHSHGKLAKKLPFSEVYTDWMFQEAKKAGLDAICLTEHFNTLQFDEMYQYVIRRCSRDGDSLKNPDGLRIFTGMETDIAEGGHILCLGAPEQILELNERLAFHKEKENFLPFEALMDLFSKYHLIVGAAHPFREGSNIPKLPKRQLARLDFLDLNGKDVAQDAHRTETLTYDMGKKLNIPVVGGSDTHQGVQYGCISTMFGQDIRTLEQLYQKMSIGAYEIHISENAANKVETAGLLKKALKEIYACGGDYVSVLLNA